jgi:hypothetical protein
MNDESTYRAYLIRFERAVGQNNWRVKLQDAKTGQVVRFATEHHLISFLLETLRKTQVDPIEE